MSTDPETTTDYNRFELISAKERPAELLPSAPDYDKAFSEFALRDYEFHIIQTPAELADTKKRFLFPISLNHAIFDSLGLGHCKNLAQGDPLHTNHPKNPEYPAGELRLYWWTVTTHTQGKNNRKEWFYDDILPVLTFTPQDINMRQMDYDRWSAMRFPLPPIDSAYEEEWKLHLFNLWTAETEPERGLAPDDSMLCAAVKENEEDLVAAILQYHGTIQMPERRIRHVSETALGIARENAGDFGKGPGFHCGCHRDYRDDEVMDEEPARSWVPRARAIAGQLRAAGAINYTPLLDACAQDDLDGVRSLLDQGFPPNFAVYGHTTALCEAVLGGNVDVCKLLLERGADPNLPRPFHTFDTGNARLRPLSLATNNPPIAALLLDAGASPGVFQGEGNQTPVLFRRQFANRANAAAIFQRVKFESIITPQRQSGVSFLSAKELDFCRDFIPKKLLNMYDSGGKTPLVNAIMDGDHAKALRLLELGASPHTRSVVWESSFASIPLLESGEVALLITPLQAALLSGNFRMLCHLLKGRADSNRTVYTMKKRIKCSRKEADVVISRFRKHAMLMKFRIPRNLKPISGNHVMLDITSDTNATGHVGPEFLGFIGEFMVKHPDPSRRFPMLVGLLDPVSEAQRSGVPNKMTQLFEGQTRLTPSVWGDLASQTLRKSRAAAIELDALLDSGDHTEIGAHCHNLLLALDDAALDIDNAIEQVGGKRLNDVLVSEKLRAEATTKTSTLAGHAREILKGSLEILLHLNRQHVIVTAKMSTTR